MPCYNTTPYKRLKWLLSCPCSLYRPHHKTSHRDLQGRFLQFVPFYRCIYQTDTSSYNTACATLERITAAAAPPAHTRYQHHARTLYRSTQPSYYNKVYKGATVCPVMDPCQTVPQTMPARRLAIWHRSAVRAHRLALSTRRGSPVAGGAEPLTAAAASLFGLSPDS